MFIADTAMDDHHDAVQADQRVVGGRREIFSAGLRLLEANHEGRSPTDEKQDQCKDQILNAYHLVVGSEAEIAPETLALTGQSKFLVSCGLMVSPPPGGNAVERADTAHETHGPAEIARHQGGICVPVCEVRYQLTQHQGSEQSEHAAGHDAGRKVRKQR
jgi:hypothetical protein